MRGRSRGRVNEEARSTSMTPATGRKRRLRDVRDDFTRDDQGQAADSSKSTPFCQRLSARVEVLIEPGKMTHTDHSIEHTCGVCLDENSASNFASRITDACAHENDICSHCLASHIEMQMGSIVDWGQLRCPMCKAEMSPEDARRSVPAATFDRLNCTVLVHVT